MDLLPFDEYVAQLNRKRNSAAALFHDEGQGRVLLVTTTYKTHLDLPGGAVEAEEPPWRTVAREIHEELGLIRTFTTPVVIDYTPDDGRLPEGMAWVFDAGTITTEEVDALRITSPEIQTVGLYERDEIGEHTKAELAGRIEVALEVIDEGGFALCEQGKRVR